MTYQRDTENPIRIAVVGAGSHCYRNILPALNFLPVRLLAVCDTDERLANLTAQQYGCRAYANTSDLYCGEDLDAVLLVVSERAHPALAMEAFDHELHVWMEKPAATNSDELKQMIRRRGDRVALVGFKKAFMPSTTKARELINSSERGPLESVVATYPINAPSVEDGRLGWHVNACHPLALLLACCGPARAVRAVSHGGNSGCCLIEFGNDVFCNFHFVGGPMPNETYTFFGTDWQLQINNCHEVLLHRGYPLTYSQTTSYLPEGENAGTVLWQPQNTLSTLENQALFTQGIYCELKEFCDCVKEFRRPDIGSLEFALDIMTVYEAAHRSEGERIKLIGDRPRYH